MVLCLYTAWFCVCKLRGSVICILHSFVFVLFCVCMVLCLYTAWFCACIQHGFVFVYCMVLCLYTAWFCDLYAA